METLKASAKSELQATWQQSTFHMYAKQRETKGNIKHVTLELPILWVPELCTQRKPTQLLYIHIALLT
jgi:hypothetical protein